MNIENEVIADELAFTPADPQSRGDFIEDDLNEEETETVEETETEDEPEQSSHDEGDDDDSSDDDVSPTSNEPDTNGNVPRDRLNKEIAKRRELEARLLQLESRLADNSAATEDNAPDSVIEGLTKESFSEMQEAMIEGETDVAFALFEKMLGNAVAGAKENARFEARAEVEMTKAQEQLSQKAAELSTRYPELDYQSDLADESLIGEVVELRDIHMDRGLSSAEALEKAVAYIAFENKLKDRQAPKSLDAPSRGGVKSKIDIASKEKGKLKGTSARHRPEVIDISKLNDDAFSKLSAEAIAKARGDFLE